VSAQLRLRHSIRKSSFDVLQPVTNFLNPKPVVFCRYFAKKPTEECDAFFKRKCDMIGEQVLRSIK
jgi:hypothetical protein